MKRPFARLVSKLARLLPVLLLIVAVAAAPAWGGAQKHHAKHESTPCCHAPSDQKSSQDEGDGGCCGKDCHGCIGCPCGKLVLISVLRLAPASTSSISILPNTVLSALSLSDADPIFHPPRV